MNATLLNRSDLILGTKIVKVRFGGLLSKV